MLEREISERRLQIGLQRYLRRWSYSNADWDELIKTAGKYNGTGFVGLERDMDKRKWGSRDRVPEKRNRDDG